LVWVRQHFQRFFGQRRSLTIAEDDAGFEAFVVPLRVDHAELIGLLVQALEGLSTLHSTRLIHRDFTLRNGAAARGAADLAPDCREGLRLATESSESGAAHEKLEAFGRISNEVA
jgi:anthranilate phosphoribosyltransferase